MGALDFGLIAPAEGAFAIVPSDVAALERPTRGIYVGVSGNVRVQMAKGHVVTYVGLAAGVIHAIRVIQVYDTGTVATSIVGVF